MTCVQVLCDIYTTLYAKKFSVTYKLRCMQREETLRHSGNIILTFCGYEIDSVNAIFVENK